MELQYQETVVAGGPQDFAEVRHLRLRGSNYAIGKRLAEIARECHGLRRLPAAEPLRARAQRSYLRLHYPIHLDRMRGVAAAYDLDPEGDEAELGELVYNCGDPGCSVVYYPPASTESGHGILSRNFDFTTGTVRGALPEPGTAAAVSQPYIVEVYPDIGYPSLYLCAYDLLGGCLDGINSAGLVVALLADRETANSTSMDPTLASAVGLNEIQITRLLLDTCADVDEAKQALLTNKQFYGALPCHYIIADRRGRSFVWEHSHAYNKEYIIDGDGPQVITNHPLHRYRSTAELPADAPINTYDRYRMLLGRIQGQSGRYSTAFIKATNACVAACSPATNPAVAPSRTLWHGLYDIDAHSLEIDFYLGDVPDAEQPGRTRIVRSGYRMFRMDCL